HYGTPRLLSPRRRDEILNLIVARSGSPNRRPKRRNFEELLDMCRRTCQPLRESGTVDGAPFGLTKLQKPVGSLSRDVFIAVSTVLHGLTKRLQMNTTML